MSRANKLPPAGLRAVFARIDRAARAAKMQDSRHRKPTAAQLVRQYRQLSGRK